MEHPTVLPCRAAAALQAALKGHAGVADSWLQPHADAGGHASIKVHTSFRCDSNVPSLYQARWLQGRMPQPCSSLPSSQHYQKVVSQMMYGHAGPEELPPEAVIHVASALDGCYYALLDHFLTCGWAAPAVPPPHAYFPAITASAAGTHQH